MRYFEKRYINYKINFKIPDIINFNSHTHALRHKTLTFYMIFTFIMNIKY